MLEPCSCARLDQDTVAAYRCGHAAEAIVPAYLSGTIWVWLIDKGRSSTASRPITVDKIKAIDTDRSGDTIVAGNAYMSNRNRCDRDSERRYEQ